MGNTLGGKKTTKVMKIDGQTMKFKTPIYANEVLRNYPTMVLLESEAVKHFGVRAKPLEPQQELKPKRLYFLVELPKYPEQKTPRRVRSGIQMSAKDRLETLMLARRSVSDLSIMKPASITAEESTTTTQYTPTRWGLAEESLYHNNFASCTLLNNKTENGGGPVRVKLRLPRAEVEKLMTQSKDEGDVAEKIMRLCLVNNGGGGGGGGGVDMFQNKSGPLLEEQSNWKNNNGGIIKKGIRSREKRVGFLPITEGRFN